MKTWTWMMYNYNYIFVFVFSSWLGQIGCDNRTCFSCLISHVNGDYNNCAGFDPENEENVREAGDSLCTVITMSVYKVSHKKVYHKNVHFMGFIVIKGKKQNWISEGSTLNPLSSKSRKWTLVVVNFFWDTLPVIKVSLDRFDEVTLDMWPMSVLTGQKME